MRYYVWPRMIMYLKSNIPVKVSHFNPINAAIHSPFPLFIDEPTISHFTPCVSN